ncbi:MAG TPA: hypothetical protein VJY62_10650, partial [Bacteroidia bacterium]|nr:hypothetical protein [Bacteroidia bacterium]
MKTLKNIIIFSAFIAICFNAPFSFGKNFTWTGTTDTCWNKNTNWSPNNNGFPTSNDTVSIGSTTNHPSLDTTRSIYKLSMSANTLNLCGYTLTSSNYFSMSGGTINSGSLITNGERASFGGGTLNVIITGSADRVFIAGSTFNYSVALENKGTATTQSNGGSTFNAKVSITKTAASTGNFSISNSTGNTFNDTAIFINNSTGDFVVSNLGNTYFNGNIYVGSSTVGGIIIGNSGSGTSTLASGKKLYVDAGGFVAGSLELNYFTQAGSTAQSITLTNVAVINCYKSVFNGNTNFTAPGILLKHTIFNGIDSLTQTGGTGTSSYGGNTFNAASVFHCTGNHFKFAVNAGDTLNSDVTISGTVDLITYTASILKGNFYVAAGPNFTHLSSFDGTLVFAGNNAQVIHGIGRLINMNKIKIDKSGGSVTLDTTVSINDTLFLVNKNLITTSSHLLSMLAGSVVSGTSNNSFVSGPVQKTGNTAFVFPTGKGSDYRAIEISAPASVTYAYTGEYFNTGQSLGNSMDGTIKYIHDCSYWNLARNTGTSNVTVSLSWDSAACDLLDSATVKVGNWNGSTWKDLGNGGVTGNKYVGKVANSATVITWGNFALAYNKCFLTAAAGSDQGNCAGDSAIIGGSPVATMGMTPYTYSWSPSSGLSSTSVANPKANPSSTTNYIVTVTDLSGCSAQDTVTITPHPLTFTWTGAVSSAWENSANWSPVGTPLYCDNVIIVSGSNNVQISSDVAVTGFTINSGTLNLQSYNLDISGKATFNSGTINSGWIYVSNTDTALFNGTHFGADITADAYVILLNGSEFDKIAEFTQQGNSNSTSSGGNVFDSTMVLVNTGDGNIYLANSSADTFNDDATFYMSGDGTIYPGYTKNTSFGGNLLLSYHPVPSNGTVVFGANGGKAIFNGNTTQTISYAFSGFGIMTDASNADTMAIFKKIQINKPDDNLVLEMSVRVTDSLILTKGNIVSDTTNLLCMRAGSVVTGAADTSFVEGPVKKFGNTAFVFPTG